MTVGWSPARLRLAPPVMALALGGLVVLLAAALAALSVMTRHNPLTAAGDDIAIGVPFAAVGVFVARRQPGNAIGWLMISTAMCALLYADAGFYAVYDYRMGHSLPFGPAAVLLYQGWLPTIASVPLVILLFRTGGCRRRGGAWCCGPIWGWSALTWPY